MTQTIFYRDTKLLWLFASAVPGAPGLFGSFAMLQIGVTSRADFILLASALLLVLIALLMIWRALRPRADKTAEIALEDREIRIIQPLWRQPLEFTWDEVDAIQMLRTYFAYGPGQMSISLTARGAERLGLATPTDAYCGPGTTGRKPPRRWHVAVPIGTIKQSWEEVFRALETHAEQSGFHFELKKSYFGVGSKRIWTVVSGKRGDNSDATTRSTEAPTPPAITDTGD